MYFFVFLIKSIFFFKPRLFIIFTQRIKNCIPKIRQLHQTNIRQLHQTKIRRQLDRRGVSHIIKTSEEI
jgi:hypothetical protein